MHKTLSNAMKYSTGRGAARYKYATMTSLVVIMLCAGNAMAANTYTTYDKTESVHYYDPTTGALVADADRTAGVEYIEHAVPEFTKQTNDITFNTEYGNGTEKMDITLSDGTNVTYYKDPANTVGSRTSVSSDMTVNKSYVGSTYSSMSAGGAALGISGTGQPTIDGITGDFVNNVLTLTSTSTQVTGGGAIYSRSGTIGDIVGDFINNSVVSQAKSGTSVHGGGAIYNGKQTASEQKIPSIASITGNFIGNYVDGLAMADGGAIVNNDSATIGDINGSFIKNYTEAKSDTNNGQARGGAIFSSTNTTMGDITGDFIENHAHGTNFAIGGAAAFNSATVGTIRGDFIGNYIVGNGTGTTDAATTRGGAIYAEASTITGIDGTFANNYAQATGGDAKGGAIRLNKTTVKNDITGNFYENHVNGYAGAYGGAIYNDSGSGKSIISGIANGAFVKNYAESETATAQGGAIANKDTITNGITNADFFGNYAVGKSAAGGAIYNYSSYTVGAISGRFVGNYIESNESETSTSTLQGGAIYTSSTNLPSVAGLIYDNHASGNAAKVAGGALYKASGTITSLTADFIENSAKSKTGTAQGGALYNAGGNIDTIDSWFIGNSAISESGAVSGGAIFNGTQKQIVYDSVTGSFVNNTAKTNTGLARGGAIYNGYDNSGTFTGDFVNNSAVGGIGYGGAVYNGGDTLTFTSVFADNTATTDGGAIYNADGGTISFVGRNIFTNNTAGDALNDIYNDGDITVAQAASVYLDGGITGSDGTLNIANGAAIYSNAKTTIGNTTNNSGTIVINDGYALNMTNTLNMQDGGYVQLGVDSVLNITKDLVSDGTAVFGLTMYHDDDLNPTTNLITVGGDISGTSHLMVTVADAEKLGSDFALGRTWTKFLTAQNDDEETAADFVIDRVETSPFAWETARNYRDETDGSHWYLKVQQQQTEQPGDDNTDDDNPGDTPGGDNPGDKPGDNPVYVAEVPAYTALHQIAWEQNRGVIADVQRALTLEKFTHCHNDDSCHFKLDEHHPRFWANATYTNATIKSPAEFDASTAGATLGMDMYRDQQNQFGLFGAYRHGSYDLNGRGRYTALVGTDVTNNSYMGGVYYKHYYNDFDMFGMVYVGTQDLKLETHDNVVRADTNAMQYGMNIGVEKNFMLTGSLVLSPFVDASYMFLDIDKIHDNAGKTANPDNLNYFDAEVGVLMEYIPYGSAHTARLYFKPSVVQTFSHGGYTRITGIADKIDTFSNRAMGRTEIGGEWKLGGRLNANALAGYTFGEKYNGFDVNAGISIKF